MVCDYAAMNTGAVAAWSYAMAGVRISRYLNPLHPIKMTPRPAFDRLNEEVQCGHLLRV
jgi:hypothetical protein